MNMFAVAFFFPPPSKVLRLSDLGRDVEISLSDTEVLATAQCVHGCDDTDGHMASSSHDVLGLYALSDLRHVHDLDPESPPPPPRAPKVIGVSSKSREM